MINRDKSLKSLLCDKALACRHTSQVALWRPHSGKLFDWNTLLPFTTLFPQPCKVTSISEFLSVSPASLLEGFVFPQYHLICQKNDMILVWMLWYCAYRPCERITSYHLSRSHLIGQNINAAIAVQQHHTQAESPSIKAVQFSFHTSQKIVVTQMPTPGGGHTSPMEPQILCYQ